MALFIIIVNEWDNLTQVTVQTILFFLYIGKPAFSIAVNSVDPNSLWEPLPNGMNTTVVCLQNIIYIGISFSSFCFAVACFLD